MSFFSFLIKLLSSCYVSKIVATQNEYKTKKRKGELKMKKILLTIVAGMLMTANVMAQEANQNRPERRQMDPKEMVKQRTDQTVQQYKLNEEQAAKLLELNKKYAEQMRQRGPRMGRGNRGGRPERMDRANRDSMKQKPMQRPDRKLKRERGPQGMNQMEGYEAELKTILTEKQYEAYAADRKKMMESRRSQRPQMNNNSDIAK
jgi:hypothetical protein